MGTAWQRRDQDIVIGHISDMHLGSPKTGDTWKLAASFLREKVKPELLVVSGDLVDTPDKKLYDEAKEKLDALGVPYLVCAGNHDRHAKGNRLGRLWPPSRWLGSDSHVAALFDTTFTTAVVQPNLPREITLSRQVASRVINEWKVGVLGIDSSSQADWSARGYVATTAFDAIRGATRNKEWDLCIFAVHHHLFSVRALEALREGKLTDLANLTCLLNSGSLLELLADSRIDVALHGHEHMHNWGVYGTLGGSRGQVRVIGAGSVTGNKTLDGGNDSRISLNLLVLTPEKTGTLKRIARAASDWEVVDDVTLFDGRDVRRSWLRRRWPDEAIDQELLKFVEMTPERDVKVRWLFVRRELSGPLFEHPITNWSGDLDKASLRARLRTQDGHEIALRSDDITAALPSQLDRERWPDARFVLKFPVAASHQKRPITVELNYTWLRAATLTMDELETVHTEGRDVEHFRKEGYEFSTIWSERPLAAAELVVSLPADFAPETVSVHVRQNGADHPAEAVELEARALARGTYALRVPSPRTGRDYTLAWRPVEKRLGPDAPAVAKYERRLRETGIALLTEFCDPLLSTALKGRATVALYVRDGGLETAKREAFRVIGEKPLGDRAVPEPGESYALTGLSAVAIAWRGQVPTIPTRPTQPSVAKALGFADGELGLICVPLRFSFSATNSSPLACVRIGTFDDQAGLSDRDTNAMISRLLPAAAMRLLGRLFEEVDDG